MEIRVSKNEINLDIKSLATQYLKDKGFPIPDNVEIVEDGEEIVVVFDPDNATPATTTKKPVSRSRSKAKAEKPEPEPITTHPGSFVQGDAEVAPEPSEDVFPSASDPEVAPQTNSVFGQSTQAASTDTNIFD